LVPLVATIVHSLNIAWPSLPLLPIQIPFRRLGSLGVLLGPKVSFIRPLVAKQAEEPPLSFFKI